MHRFQVDGLRSDLRVVGFEGSEGVSQLYRFNVTVACADNELAFASVVGQPAALTFRVGDEPRHVHGVVSSFEQGEEGKKLTAYRATLVPAVWRLRYRRASRIFQDLTTPDILKAVLQKAGIALAACRFSLSGRYKPREYCVQYRESDWDFMSRLMEEDGIFYYFEHTEDKHMLVVGDASSAHAAILGEATLPFRAPSGALVGGEHVSRYRYAERVRPGKVTLRDYNFKKPSLTLEGTQTSDADTDLEIYDYPGDYEEPGAGEDVAKLDLERLQATRKTGEGDSACPRLTPGHLFSIKEHARDDFNREYLITRVEHRGYEPHMDGAAGADAAPYANSFEVIPSDVSFRPPRLTPVPTIKGIQTAVVVGPSGEEIHTDEHGRIKVQFHWDREGKKNEHSSCWIRVSQAWAGAAWGALFIPRIGQEVVVDFIEGDPDRPLVVGSVYHAANVPPYPLPAEKTKSTLKSSTSSGGGGFNELRFEDKKGSEEIFLHGQKDWTIEILNDKNQAIGHDEALVVLHDRTKSVGNDQSETVGGYKSIEVVKDHTESIGGSESLDVGENLTVSVGKNSTESIGADQTVSVGANASVSIGAAMSLSVGGGKSESVAESSSESVTKSKTTTVEEDYTLTVNKSMTATITKDSKEEVKEKKTLIVGKKLAIQVGDATITIEKNGNVTVQGKNITVKGEGPIAVEGKKLSVKSEGAVNVEASGKIKVKGSNVGIN
jgi:type VI secretion system secreted protein VgrG